MLDQWSCIICIKGEEGKPQRTQHNSNKRMAPCCKHWRGREEASFQPISLIDRPIKIVALNIFHVLESHPHLTWLSSLSSSPPSKQTWPVKIYFVYLIPANNSIIKWKRHKLNRPKTLPNVQSHPSSQFHLSHYIPKVTQTWKFMVSHCFDMKNIFLFFIPKNKS